MNIALLGSIVILLDLVGFFLAYLYGRKTKGFIWKEYFLILIFPLIGIFLFAFLIDLKVLYLFIISSFVGLILEYLVGLTYSKTLNKRLWTYNRLHIDGYTSWLALPMWGIAGVTFWFFSKLIGL